MSGLHHSLPPLPQMPKKGTSECRSQEILGAIVKTASHLLPKSQAQAHPQPYKKDEHPAWGFPIILSSLGRQRASVVCCGTKNWITLS